MAGAPLLRALALNLLLLSAAVGPNPRTAGSETRSCDCRTQQLCEECSFEQVVRVMRAKSSDITVQTNGCAQIAKKGTALPSADDSLERSVEAVTGAMKKFPADLGRYTQLAAIPSHSKLAMLHQSCSEAIAKLAGVGNQHYQVEDAGGTKLLIDAMLAFPDEQSLLANALLALGNLVQRNPPAQTVAHSAGGERAALSAMAAFPASPLLQQYGCHTLAGLGVGENDQERRERQEAIAAAGGIDRIVGAMQKHERRWMVQEFCCYALFELVAGGGTRTDHVAAAVAAGAVEAVDSAVRKHTHAKQCAKLPDKLIDAEKKEL